MKEEYQKVQMIIEFDVPTNREAYGIRTVNTFPWKEYAEHDMLEWLKDSYEIGDITTKPIWTWELIGFKYGKKFMKEVEDDEE